MSVCMKRLNILRMKVCFKIFMKKFLRIQILVPKLHKAKHTEQDFLQEKILFACFFLYFVGSSNRSNKKKIFYVSISIKNKKQKSVISSQKKKIQRRNTFVLELSLYPFFFSEACKLSIRETTLSHIPSRNFLQDISGIGPATYIYLYFIHTKLVESNKAHYTKLRCGDLTLK